MSIQEKIIKNNTLYNLLNDALIVPDYQRDYAQGRENDLKIEDTRIQFVQDIIAASLGKRFVHTGLIYGSSNYSLKGFVAVDGQQRLTTIFLYHLYILKLSTSNDNLKERLHNFGWFGRIYASEFTEFLFELNWKIRKDQTFREFIKAAQNYFKVWEKDPTVVNMQNMLDEIHRQFSKLFLSDEAVCEVRNNLVSTGCQLVFDYLKLEDGTDEFQYQKMNSRGRDLTTYELFKQKLQSVANLPESFKSKMDNEWLIFFDRISQEKSEAEVYYQNFINETALWMGIKSCKNEFNYTDQITGSKIKDNRTDVAFVEFKAYDDLIKNITDFEKYLDWLISQYQCIESVISDFNYEEDNGALINVLENPTWQDRAINYAIYHYGKATQFAELDKQEFRIWWRIVHNLIFNQDIDSSNFKKFIESIDLFPAKDIFKYVRDEQISFFSQYQINEEKIKCRLCLDNEELIDLFKEQERLRCFQGQIGILLLDEKISSFLSSEYFRFILNSFNELVRGRYDGKGPSDFRFITAMLTFIPPEEKIDRLKLRYMHGHVRGERIPARWIKKMLLTYITEKSKSKNIEVPEFLEKICRSWKEGYDDLTKRNLSWVKYWIDNYEDCKDAFNDSDYGLLRARDNNIWLYRKTNMNDSDVLLSNRRAEILKELFKGKEEDLKKKGHDIIYYDSGRHNLKVVFTGNNIWIGFSNGNQVTLPEIMPANIFSSPENKAWQWFMGSWEEGNKIVKNYTCDSIDEYCGILKSKIEEYCDSFLSDLGL